MKILLTGSAGFIGSFVVKRLLERGDTVVGLDNINDYYEPTLKYGRLAEAGIYEFDVDWYKLVSSSKYSGYRFIRMNLEDRQAMRMLFANEGFDAVINLAAQAGVRYSITNPYAYIESNLDGFINILEGCRHHSIRHLVYASSSSVYGLNANVPFSEHSSIAHPVSLYAASKKSNELMAHAYSHLFGVPSTGLRFFTVYGPWGRPDMSPFLFTDAILHDRPIKVFNNGDMLRDFTYIDNVIQANELALLAEAPEAVNQVYNVAFGERTTLNELFRLLRENLAEFDPEIAKIEAMHGPDRIGDIPHSLACIDKARRLLGYAPEFRLQQGLKLASRWYFENL